MSVPLLLFLLALGIGATGLALRAWHWHRGRADARANPAGLLSVPRRYLVHVHGVVSREPAAARMHVLVAGSVAGMLVLIPIVHGFAAGRIAAWALIVLAAIALVGAATVLWRRRGVRFRLSGGAFNRLPFALAAFGAFYLLATLPMVGAGQAVQWLSLPGLALVALGSFGCLELLGGVGGGPIKHALTGALHLAFHPRPERFDGGVLASQLEPLDLAQSKLGVEKSRDFKWTQLLSFDACVECGKCEAACPALASGMPLNPKALVQELLRAQRPVLNHRYGGRGHWPGRGIRESWNDSALIGQERGIHPDTLWACTTCRSCVEECPMFIEHVDAVIDMRRFQALELGALPGKAALTLDNLRETDDPEGRPLAEKLQWAGDLNLPLLARKGSCDVLLWMGSCAHELRGQQVLRALVRLLRAAGVDFAVLGDEERDSGDVARRLGEEAEFQRLAAANIATLGRYRFNRIVTADPHALHALRNEYRAFGGRYEVVHHSAHLLELIEGGKLSIDAPVAATLTYHDPCYLARYNGEIDAPRKLIARLGARLEEMQRHGKRSFCCGGGGGVPQTDVRGERRIADVRMEQAVLTSASGVVVACPGCMSMLSGVPAPALPVQDLAELTLTAAGLAE